MDIAGMVVTLMVGIGIGYGISFAIAKKPGNASSTTDYAPPNWWKTRQSLTGTQLEILQYMEAKKDVSITGLQEKFSFIPDRELYYRLEQIVLMKFLIRERKEGEVHYVLNPDYSGTVEDDKTVMLGSR
jgi:hypothetical protein